MDQAKMIKEQRIVELNDETIFDQNAQYVIPRYQRAYAWEYDEIVQLIEDIKDATSESNSNNYYIGTLVVCKIKDDPETYEVIDGQQRLTTLYLLLSYLSFKEFSDIKTPKKNLRFDCRKRSNYTLQNIEEVLKNSSVLEDERLEQSILNGVEVIRQKFESEKLDVSDFYERLKSVILYRIEVPEHTDLNKYFEIMNTRGEQLEQSDILKARLMSFLEGNREEQELFAKIWDACSDMTGYVQMHFNKSDREQIFGDSWNVFPQKDFFSSLVSSYQSESDSSERELTELKLTIKEIISSEFNPESQLGNVDSSNEDADARFESIISFPHFLLHAIRLYLPKEKQPEEVGLDKSLDEKKLISDFDFVVKSTEEEVVDKDQGKKSNKADFAKGFIQHLLQLRYLFDKFIIKREFREENLDGEWSLKELKVSGQDSKKKAYYSNTALKDEGEEETRNNECLMIQAALRVSYTSPKVMHWITELLNWLRDNHNNLEGLTDEGEKIAAEATSSFLNKRNYKLGVQTPRIVFNFLDYLLWKKDKGKYSDFQFEFRNSVEHWYPQHPSQGTFEAWSVKYPAEEKLIDSFGNLCLITRRVNSRFSNQSPEAKMKDNSKTIENGSLKLRKMANITKEKEVWNKVTCEGHQKEMIDILEMAQKRCNPN